jgi:hypothetical protein
MIVTIQAQDERHARFIEFSAMKAGMHVDQYGRYLDHTVRDREKVLGVIREAGGRIFDIAQRVELTKEERFAK